MRTDKMASTHDRPHRIGAAGAVYQQRAARPLSGKICLFVDAGRRVPARPGIVPSMPLPGSQPKAVYLVCWKYPLDILRQVVGLCNVHKDMIPAAVAAAQPAAWNDAVFVSQPIQCACRRFIYGRIHAVDEVLLRCNRKFGSGFPGVQGDIVIVNQYIFFLFWTEPGHRRPTQQKRRRHPAARNRRTQHVDHTGYEKPNKLPPTGTDLSGYLTLFGPKEQFKLSASIHIASHHIPSLMPAL